MKKITTKLVKQKSVAGYNSGGNRKSVFSSKGFQTKIIRSSKGQKGKRIPHKLYYKFGKINQAHGIRYGRFVLKAAKLARLSAHELEAARRTLKKLVAKRFYLLMRVYPFVAVTKRPSDVRMGKGKGTKIVDWIYPVKPGKILCELVFRKRRKKNLTREIRYESTVKDIFAKVADKFSIPVKFMALL